MSTIKANAILDASGGNTVTINSVTPTAYNTMGKNRIINGAMEIDQRNAGSSVTPSNGDYVLDRYQAITDGATGKYSVQQVTDAPSGYQNSMKFTSLSAYTPASTNIFHVAQKIEGNNFSDAAFGTSDAKTVTISFWTKSSLTGTFGGSLVNSAENRAYPYTYTINSANTWEQKSITITGDTTGTWVTGTGIGARVHFTLGLGSSRTATAGAWTGTSGIFGPTGGVNLVETSGATLYITGVQLEVGSVATEFERRPYGTELNLCYRYFQKTNPDNVSLRSGGLNGVVYSSTNCVMYYTLPVLMRSAPSIARGGTNDNFYIAGISSSISGTFNSAFSSAGTVWAEIINLSGGGNGYGIQYNGQLSLSSEL